MFWMGSRRVSGSQEGERQVLLQIGSAAPGSRGRVPVALDSLGDENAVEFSVRFDPAALSDPRIELAAPYADAFLETDDSQAASGRLGIRLILLDGAVFERGVRTLFQINFAIAEVVAEGPQPIEMADAPIERSVRDADGEELAARFGDGTLSVVPGIEADVEPEPPDGEVREGDVERIADVVTGTETAAPGAEFQRADCAPLATRGDGRLTVADWVQAGRVQTALDEPVAAGGPSSIADATGPGCDAGIGWRQLRVGDAVFVRGQANALSIVLDAAGDENAVGFTLNFDPARVRFEWVDLAAELAERPEFEGLSLRLAPERAAQGMIGVAMALPPGRVFPAGSAALLTFAFTVPADGTANTTTFSLDDSLVTREIAGASAQRLCAEFYDATIPFTPEVTLAPVLTSLDPPVLFARGSVLSVLLNGENFNAASIARVNDLPRATEFLNAGQLQLTLLAEDIAAAGSLAITVENPGEGGGISNALELFIVQRAPGDNARPQLFGVTPSVVLVGRLPFALRLSGSGFAQDSVARIKGQDRRTKFLSETQLEVTVTAADLAVAGELPVQVFNPPPGGGTSSEVRLSVRKPNPVPHLTQLALEENASGGYTLTLLGSNFLRESQVRINGSQRSVSFVSSTRLTASYTLQELAAAAGTLVATVTNPPLGGGRSSSVSLAITGLSVPANRAPSLFSITPSVVAIGSPPVALQASGSGFVAGAVLQLNGRPLATTFVNSSQLRATVGTSDLLRAARLEVRVVNPDSGGEKSSAVTLEVKPRNPDPRIADAAPVAGNSSLLQLTGSNFLSTSVARVGGQSRSTSFVNGTTLRMSLSSSDLSAAGVLAITVFNPAPGGGASNVFEYAVTEPVVSVSSSPPSISSIKPRLATAGGPGVLLQVNGSNFRPGAVVRVNNRPRQTQFINARLVRALVSNTEMTTPGALAVTVVSQDALGGTSNSATLTIKRQSPAPQLAAIEPGAINAGGRDFQLQVLGAGFINGSVVRVNKSARPTSFVNNGELSATIFSSDISTQGRPTSITVTTDAPGGGTSLSQPLLITTPVNPAPSLSSLSPTLVGEGSAAVRVTIRGQRFLPGSVVRVDNQARSTAFVSSTQLTALLPASDFARSRTLSIQVYNPEPGGGLSSALSLEVKKRYPVPRITSLGPAAVTAGDAGFTLTINGSNFFRESTVRVKGSVRSFNFVNAGQLTISISAFELARPGSLAITVANPAPGGGTSNAAQLMVQ